MIIVTHNSRAFIETVLDTLAATATPTETIVVDSASTDGTPEIVAGYPVTLIRSEVNIGFAAACHEGARAASGDVYVFLGHDTIPHEGWLEPLVDAVRDPGVGASMATIEDAALPGTFNTSGGSLTYAGLAWITDRGQPIPETEPDLIDVAFPSGSAMAITADTWASFAGFRPDLFMYHEDTDLGWRLRLGGRRIVRASASRVTHRYDFSRSPGKMYLLERNRWILLLTNYRWSTIALLSPALVLTDLGVWFVAIRDGWASDKARSWRSVMAERATWSRFRSDVARQRAIGDAAILPTMQTSVSTAVEVAPPRGSGLVDRALTGYLRLVLPLIGRLEARRTNP